VLLVESESLLNDGAAAVLFVMALAWAQSAGHAQASLEMVTTLVRIVLGGVIIGAAFGGVAILVAQRTSEHLIEAALTTVTAYGAFLAAEYFDVSGVLATVTAGLTIGVAKGALIHTDEYDIYARVSYGDTDTRPFATDAANMRAIRTATAFMKSMSIRWRAFGRCCVHGCDRIAASPKKSCRSTSRSSSSCTTPENVEKRC
jgi:hypothetical protein